MQRGSFQMMKTLNKSIILNKIRTDGPISRAQIAKETELTPPTVGTIVKELIGQGIVKESNQGDSQGGRKPTMLVINPSAFTIIGVDAGPESVKVILTDLSGHLTNTQVLPIEKGIESASFLHLLKEGIRAVMDQARVSGDKLLGIGVAMHGVVDSETGMAIYAPNLNLRQVPIKKELENTFNCLVKVDNDARAMALGEAWFGGHKHQGSMVAVNLGRGVGAGWIVNGNLFRGDDGIAGEIGHMTIDVNGDICQCGNRGCLQTLASGPAISARTVKKIQQSPEAFPEHMQNGDEFLEGETVFRAAEAGNQACRDILIETGEYIGVGLLNLIHVVNPGRIVLGGGVTNASDYIMEPARKVIQQRALTEKAKHTLVEVSHLGKEATALGAVSLLLVELFDSSMNGKTG